MMSLGRPSKILPDTIHKILELLGAGYSIRRVFRILDVHHSTFYRHLKSNPDFATRVAKIKNSPENFQHLSHEYRRALIIAAIHQGCWTKADIQAHTRLSEWVVRTILEELESEKLVCRRRQSSSGAANPLLYSLS